MSHLSSGRTGLLKVYERDQGICWLCEKKVASIEDASRDHVISRMAMRNHVAVADRTAFGRGNIRLAHKSCNNERHNASDNLSTRRAKWRAD